MTWNLPSACAGTQAVPMRSDGVDVCASETNVNRVRVPQRLRAVCAWPAPGGRQGPWACVCVWEGLVCTWEACTLVVGADARATVPRLQGPEMSQASKNTENENARFLWAV